MNFMLGHLVVTIGKTTLVQATYGALSSSGVNAAKRKPFNGAWLSGSPIAG